jgi:hypothetical protein
MGSAKNNIKSQPGIAIFHEKFYDYYQVIFIQSETWLTHQLVYDLWRARQKVA